MVASTAAGVRPESTSASAFTRRPVTSDAVNMCSSAHPPAANAAWPASMAAVIAPTPPFMMISTPEGGDAANISASASEASECNSRLSLFRICSARSIVHDSPLPAPVVRVNVVPPPTPPLLPPVTPVPGCCRVETQPLSLCCSYRCCCCCSSWEVNVVDALVVYCCCCCWLLRWLVVDVDSSACLAMLLPGLMRVPAVALRCAGDVKPAARAAATWDVGP
mmetsp:Transcript_14037/g.33954  ORF Transcript_14037/g.33954 Transcript_14037/m.33954 type:complete len:221 (+) Transcript_14037:458-1120(+)